MWTVAGYANNEQEDCTWQSLFPISVFQKAHAAQCKQEAYLASQNWFWHKVAYANQKQAASPPATSLPAAATVSSQPSHCQLGKQLKQNTVISYGKENERALQALVQAEMICQE